MTDAASPLQHEIDVWWTAVNDLADLLDTLDPDDWHRPTDLPGWDVHAVVAHTAHLEHLTAGGRHEDVAFERPAHVRSDMGLFTEAGVVARADRTPAELVGEIRTDTARRHEQLLADPPTQPDEPALGLFGAIGWTTRTLLRNRPLDVWMHEQDVRRAVGRPGGLDSPAAAHVVDYLSESLGYVLAKRLKEAPGTALVVHVEGHEPVTARVNDDGRGAVVPGAADDAAATLVLDRETFILAAGGRRPVALDAARKVEGDEALAARVLEALAVTP